jgi:hypothetical protein
MSNWEMRARLAGDRLAENASLTADVDDTAASALLSWGRACARDIARGTEGPADEQAEAAMEPRLGAANRLLRAVARFVAHRDDMEPAVRIALMAHIVEQAGIAYAGESPALDRRGRADLLYSLREVDEPAQVIATLRAALEPAHHVIVPPSTSRDQDETGSSPFGRVTDEIVDTGEASDADDVADYGATGDAPEEEL